MDQLNNPICKRELWDAIGDMNKQSCVGIDRLFMHFYIKHCDLLKYDMLAGM